MRFRVNQQTGPAGIRSPIQTPWEPRTHGYVPGGRTGGDAREWLFNATALEDGIIDRSTLRIEEFF